MLRIHFTPEDFGRIRLARRPDPLRDITCSLHRLQTTRGRLGVRRLVPRQALANDTLPPVLVYPLQHAPPPASTLSSDASPAALLGRTRAAALRNLALGATTSELAQVLGVSPATATHHTSVLRDAGLVLSQRVHNTVLHTLTPLGAALLRPPAPAASDEGGASNSAAQSRSFDSRQRS
ncbi:ArsR/SmtB family transcription factor [Streptomyces sp. NPDC087787]|uniref:ArsR/SmtB family transcription factor n=1 Tax=Streptomyces sp. NPDC087787 TaxID=3365803 RepID=UPI003823E559